MKVFLVALAAFAAVSRVAAAGPPTPPKEPGKKDCHCLPEDACWPKKGEWDKFNSTVKGALVKVTPIGAVCHDPTYDEAACAELKKNWDDVKIQYVQSPSKSLLEGFQ